MKVSDKDYLYLRFTPPHVRQKLNVNYLQSTIARGITIMFFDNWQKVRSWFIFHFSHTFYTIPWMICTFFEMNEIESQHHKHHLRKLAWLSTLAWYPEQKLFYPSKVGYRRVEKVLTDYVSSFEFEGNYRFAVSWNQKFMRAPVSSRILTPNRAELMSRLNNNNRNVILETSCHQAAPLFNLLIHANRFVYILCNTPHLCSACYVIIYHFHIPNFDSNSLSLC